MSIIYISSTGCPLQIPLSLISWPIVDRSSSQISGPIWILRTSFCFVSLDSSFWQGRYSCSATLSCILPWMWSTHCVPIFTLLFSLRKTTAILKKVRLTRWHRKKSGILSSIWVLALSQSLVRQSWIQRIILLFRHLSARSWLVCMPTTAWLSIRWTWQCTFFLAAWRPPSETLLCKTAMLLRRGCFVKSHLSTMSQQPSS